MTPIVRLAMLTNLTRAFDAFRASDSMAIGEAFEPHAFLIAHVDPKLLNLAGLLDPE